MRRALIALSLTLVFVGGWLAWQPLNALADQVTQNLVPSQTVKSAIDTHAAPAVAARSIERGVTIAEPSTIRTAVPSSPVDADVAEHSRAPSVSSLPVLFHYQLVTPNRRYAVSSETQLTVLGLMDQLASQGFAYTSERYDFGVFVTGIDGLQNSPASRQYWTYAVNDQTAVVGANQYHLEDNDTVHWTYSAT